MVRQGRRTGRGGWVFLLLVPYGATAAVEPETAHRAFGFFVNVMRSVLPVLVIVFFLLLAADLFFEPKWIKRNLGEEAGIKGWLLVLAGGVLASGPIYTWYALLRELRAKGMRAPLAAVFLYSRAVKLPLIPLMLHYFGTIYTLVLCLYLLVFSIVNGMLMVTLENRETA